MKGHSQMGEDRRIAELCAQLCPENRSYVDVGAGDWAWLSNSLAFYDRGWSGVLIEPNEQYHADYRKYRPRDVALLAACGTDEKPGVPFFLNDAAPEFSTAVVNETQRLTAARGLRYREVYVPQTTLARVAADHGEEPAFCSVDVEGAEEAVLSVRGRFRPCLFVIETREYATDRDTSENWRRLIDDYTLYEELGVNAFYVRNDLVGRLEPGAAFGSTR